MIHLKGTKVPSYVQRIEPPEAVESFVFACDCYVQRGSYATFIRKVIEQQGGYITLKLTDKYKNRPVDCIGYPTYFGVAKEEITCSHINLPMMARCSFKMEVG